MIYMDVSNETPSSSLADCEIQFRGFGCPDNAKDDTLVDLFPGLEQNEESPPALASGNANTMGNDDL